MRQSRYDFHPITESEAREAIAWQYTPPQDYYNLDPAPDKQAQHLAYYLNPHHQIYSATNVEGRFLACASFGRDARVAGPIMRWRAVMCRSILVCGSTHRW